MSVEQRNGGLMRRLPRRWAVLGLGIVVAGVLSSAVVAKQFDDGRDLVAAIEVAPLTRVADVPAGDGSPARGVFVQVTETGHVCVWEAASATSRERGGGCNSADDPLNGRPLSFTLGYDGGPAIADVESASLVGIASSAVARAAVLMSDGSMREIHLNKTKVAGDDYRAFGFRFKKADLRKGIGPTAVVAFDIGGAEIDRQSTGIGG
jgi:hypothetical protein